MTQNQEEIVPLNNLSQNGSSIQTYRSIFMNCDANQDGFICINELDHFIQAHKDECKIISRDIVRKIHRRADKDGDKKLDFDEFYYLVTHKNFQEFLGQYVSGYVNFLVPRPKPQQARQAFGLRSARIDSSEDDDISMAYEYTCCPPPIFLFLISIMEFAFFISDEINSKDSTLTGSGMFAQLFVYDPQKRDEAWRYLTYIFVHIGYQHLCYNLAVQLILGIPLEMVHKWWRMLIIYFTGGIAGSLMHSILDPNYKLGGASGSVYALLTSHIANVIMNWSEMTYPIIQLVIFVILVVTDVGASAYQRYYLKVQNNIGVAAHMGGAIAGLLVGIYTLRNLKLTNTEKYIWWAALVVYIVLMGVAIIINIFCSNCFV